MFWYSIILYMTLTLGQAGLHKKVHVKANQVLYMNHSWGRKVDALVNHRFSDTVGEI